MGWADVNTPLPTSTTTLVTPNRPVVRVSSCLMCKPLQVGALSNPCTVRIWGQTIDPSAPPPDDECSHSLQAMLSPFLLMLQLTKSMGNQIERVATSNYVSPISNLQFAKLTMAAGVISTSQCNTAKVKPHHPCPTFPEPPDRPSRPFPIFPNSSSTSHPRSPFLVCYADGRV